MCGGSRSEARAAKVRAAPVAAATAAPPGHVLLASPSGRVLTHALLFEARATDDAMWVAEDAAGRALGHGDARAAVRYRSAAVAEKPVVLWAKRCEPAAGAAPATLAVHLAQDEGGARVLAEPSAGGAVDRPPADAGPTAAFAVEVGPVRLPSEHLEELRSSGFTKLRVASAADIASMKSTITQRMESLVAQREASGEERSGKGRMQEFNLNDDAEGGDDYRLVEQAPLFARLHANPVMLHLLEAFTGGPVRAAHPPSTRITMPQDGSLGPGGGWHCDTPYNGAVFRAWQRDSSREDFPDVTRPLGVQCNLCVDDYTTRNGGTMYVPQSWALGRQPPQHFNEGMPNHPAVPDGARQMTASAGTLLIYHAATYHRLHVNLSDKPRIGVLQSFVPDFIRELHGDEPDDHARRALAGWLEDGHEPEKRREGYERFACSEAARAMRARETLDIRQIWTGGDDSRL
eukprot:COSAG06_NODE_1572_length_9064_cov_8.042052_5_plen_461_part_00